MLEVIRVVKKQDPTYAAYKKHPSSIETQRG